MSLQQIRVLNRRAERNAPIHYPAQTPPDVLEQLPILKEQATGLSGMYSYKSCFQDISKVYFQAIRLPMHSCSLVNRHPPTTCPLGKNGIPS